MPQSMMEAGGAQAASAGLGAGMAVSAGHGRVVTRSYESLVAAQQAALAQTRAIQTYMNMGCQFEAKKQWDNAEKSYNYVLRVIALRDGPGSPKSVPALQRLVSVSEAQNQIDRAIDFQETVLAFAQRAEVPNVRATLDAQLNLCSLFVHKEDYASAESVLSDSVALCNSNTSIKPERRRLALRTYAKVLRKLHKDTDADKIEALEAESAKLTETAKAAPANLNQPMPSVTDSTAQTVKEQTEVPSKTAQKLKGADLPAASEQTPQESH